MCAQIESLHYLLKKFDWRYSYQESSERLLLSGQSLKPIAAQLLDRFSEFITLLPHQQSKSPLNTENYEKSNGAFDKGKIPQSLAALRTCLKSSNEDGNECKIENQSRNKEFALTIFRKSAEFVEPTEKTLYHPAARQHNKLV